jgi:hypothetical protein
VNANGLSQLYLFADWVPERTAEACEANFGDVSFGEDDAFAKGKHVGFVEVNVDVAGLAVAIEFKVMVFTVDKAVAHILFAAGDLFLPEYRAGALDAHLTGDAGERRVKDELGSEADCEVGVAQGAVAIRIRHT